MFTNAQVKFHTHPRTHIPTHPHLVAPGLVPCIPTVERGGRVLGHVLADVGLREEHGLEHTRVVEYVGLTLRASE